MAEDKPLVRNIWVSGCSCCESCSDDEGDIVDITFDIPGTPKDAIDLRVTRDGLRLVAMRDEATRYVSEYAFLCPAKANKAKAHYAEGVLHVIVPLECKDPFKEVEKVKIE